MTGKHIKLAASNCLLQYQIFNSYCCNITRVINVVTDVLGCFQDSFSKLLPSQTQNLREIPEFRNSDRFSAYFFPRFLRDMSNRIGICRTSYLCSCRRVTRKKTFHFSKPAAFFSPLNPHDAHCEAKAGR